MRLWSCHNIRISRRRRPSRSSCMRFSRSTLRRNFGPRDSAHSTWTILRRVNGNRGSFACWRHASVQTFAPAWRSWPRKLTPRREVIITGLTISVKLRKGGRRSRPSSIGSDYTWGLLPWWDGRAPQIGIKRKGGAADWDISSACYPPLAVVLVTSLSGRQSLRAEQWIAVWGARCLPAAR